MPRSTVAVKTAVWHRLRRMRMSVFDLEGQSLKQSAGNVWIYRE